MHYSDQPILLPEHDLLNRASFALKLATQVDQIKIAKEGFVFGITGEWGAGKTSVINLVRHYLLHIEMSRASQSPLDWEDAPTLVTVETLDKMLSAFTKVSSYLECLEADNKDIIRWSRGGRRAELLKILKPESQTDTEAEMEAEAADRYWQLKMRVKKNPRTIIATFSPWLITGRVELASALLGELGRALESQPEIKDALAQLLVRLSELAPIVGAGLNATPASLLGLLIEKSGVWAKNVADRMLSGKTLESVYQRLRQALLKLEARRILLIVDDLDRLPPTEAFEMVSLIKSLGNLPNVIYVLCFDNNKLSDAIGRVVRCDGAAYLEKIVQHSEELPIPDVGSLLTMLNNVAKELLDNVAEEDAKRLNVVWDLVLKHYLKRPRDVLRYANSLRAAWAEIGEFIDAADFFILQCLKLFERGMYDYIRDNLTTLRG